MCVMVIETCWRRLCRFKTYCLTFAFLKRKHDIRGVLFMANDDSAQLLRRTNPRRNTTKYYTQIYAPSRDNTSFNTSQYLMNSLIYPHNKAKTNPNPNSQYSDQTKEIQFHIFSSQQKMTWAVAKTRLVDTPTRSYVIVMAAASQRSSLSVVAAAIKRRWSDTRGVIRRRRGPTTTTLVAVVAMRTATVRELWSVNSHAVMRSTSQRSCHHSVCAVIHASHRYVSSTIRQALD